MTGTREEVRSLGEAGENPSQIARRLGLARSTVEYHLERLAAPELASARPSSSPPADVRSEVPTRRLVTDLLSEGFTRAEAARQLGITKSTVSYHARRLGASIDSRCARRYDWAAVQSYYDQGYSLSECRAQFGFSSQTWHEAVRRGAIVPRPVRLPSDEFFAAGVYRNRTYLKLRLVEEGHKTGECESCALRSWRDRPLSLALHHVNGDRDDNRVTNLQLLCPNCHSQTDTFSGRNGHRRRAQAAASPAQSPYSRA